MSLVEFGDHLVFAGGDIFTDDPPMPVATAKLDRLVEQTILDAAADDSTTLKKRVDAAFGEIDDGQSDRTFISEAVPIIEHEYGVLVTAHETREIGDLVAARR